MELFLKTQYWDDPEAASAFKVFAYKIHGLDFTEWESRGFWDSAYTPFSLFHGNTVVASVCIYSLDAIVDGVRTKIAQISGVGTLQQWRRKGLNRRLTSIGLEWAEVKKHDGVFLFSDTDAIPFYEKCGFKAITEFVETTPAPRQPKCSGVKLLNPDCIQDLEKIYRYATNRAPLSEKFSVLNAKLFMFHVLYGLRDCVFEVPDLECLVLFRRDKGILNIFDVVGTQIPRFNDLYPYVADETDRFVEFHFFADKMGIKNSSLKQLDGNNPFVVSGFPIDQPVFPYTSRA